MRCVEGDVVSALGVVESVGRRAQGAIDAALAGCVGLSEGVVRVHVF